MYSFIQKIYNYIMSICFREDRCVRKKKKTCDEINIVLTISNETAGENSDVFIKVYIIETKKSSSLDVIPVTEGNS